MSVARSVGVRGISKSGRTWRSPGVKRSNKLAVKGLKTPWKKRQLERLEKKAVKEYEQQLKEASKREKEEKRKLAEERKQRREENAKKAQIVQTLSNPKKLRRLNKKQSRMIKKI